MELARRSCSSSGDNSCTDDGVDGTNDKPVSIEKKKLQSQKGTDVNINANNNSNFEENNNLTFQLEKGKKEVNTKVQLENLIGIQDPGQVDKAGTTPTGRQISDIPDEIFLQIYIYLTQHDHANLSKFQNDYIILIYHDQTLWANFTAVTELPEFVLSRHRNHLRIVTFRDQRGTFDTYKICRLNHQLSSLSNITKLDYQNNLLLEKLCFVKSLDKLKTLNISGCGFLDLGELECLHGHQNLEVHRTSLIMNSDIA